MPRPVWYCTRMRFERAFAILGLFLSIPFIPTAVSAADPVESLFLQAFASEDPAEKTDLFQKIATQGPKSVYGRFAKGWLAESRNEPKVALEEYTAAIKLKPSFAEAFCARGILLYNQGLVQEGGNDLLHAIDLNPRLAEARDAVGVILDQQNRFEEAVREYQKAIALRPRFAMAHYNLGVAYAHEGQDDLALEAFKKAVLIKPDLAIGYFNIGKIYYNREEWDKSIAAFEKAIEANPKMAAAYYGLAVVNEEAGRKAEAIKHYQEFLKLAGDHPSPETEQAAERLKELLKTFF